MGLGVGIPFVDLIDMTLADEDTNLIPVGEAKRAIPENDPIDLNFNRSTVFQLLIYLFPISAGGLQVLRTKQVRQSISFISVNRHFRRLSKTFFMGMFYLCFEE